MIQIIEDEDLQDWADFENNEVWLLSKLNPDTELDDRLIVDEIAETVNHPRCKLPFLMTEIYKKHNSIPDYEVITRNKENFAIHAYVCDESSIRVVSDNAEMTMQGGSDDDTGNAENFNGDDERDDEDGTREM